MQPEQHRRQQRQPFVAEQVASEDVGKDYDGHMQQNRRQVQPSGRAPGGERHQQSPGLRHRTVIDRMGAAVEAENVMGEKFRHVPQRSPRRDDVVVIDRREADGAHVEPEDQKQSHPDQPALAEQCRDDSRPSRRRPGKMAGGPKTLACGSTARARTRRLPDWMELPVWT